MLSDEIHRAVDVTGDLASRGELDAEIFALFMARLTDIARRLEERELAAGPGPAARMDALPHNVVPFGAARRGGLPPESAA